MKDTFNEHLKYFLEFLRANCTYLKKKKNYHEFIFQIKETK